MKIKSFIQNLSVRFCCLCLLFLCLCNSLAANSMGQDLKKVIVSIDVKDAKVTEVFSLLEKRTSYAFFYNPRDVNNLDRVSIKATRSSLYDVLKDLSRQTHLEYRQLDRNIAVTRLVAPSSESRTINQKPVARKQVVTGKVADAATGEPLAGVSISVGGTTEGTLTDRDGQFSISISGAEKKSLQFSFIGYQSQIFKVGGKTNFEIALRQDQAGLNEVVVIGYGTQKKLNLTGAVDQVTSEVLENRSLPNLSQGLQGVIPNLNIKLGDGKPIQSPSYNIRGTTSIGQGGSALVLIDGVEGDPSLLNPNDVESISVLKDAASAAIYGARGAFGVVLITTKTPTKGKTSVSYSVSHSIKSPIVVPDLVTNGYTYAKMFNEAWSAWNDYAQTPQNINKTVKFSQDYLAEFARRDKDPSLPKVDVNSNGEYVYYGNTDWFKELYKNTTQATEHNIAFSGSTDKTSFYLTGRYFTQDGIFRYNSDDYKMYNLRAKGSSQLLSWFKVDNSTEYSNMTYHNPLNVGEGGGIWRNMADEGHAMAPLLNPDGTLTYSAAYSVGDLYYGKNGINMNNRVFKNTTAFTADLFNNHTRLKGDFTIQDRDDNSRQIRVPVPYSRKPGVIEYVGTNTNDLRSAYSTTEYLATNVYGEYENTFNGGHYFKAMVGYNYEQSTSKALSTQRNGLIYNGATDMNLALGQSIVTGGGWEKWAIMGGFYRINYSFKDRYLFEADGRYDGSSKFPDNQRYAFFPSVSAGWRVSKESFWNVNPDLISNLKVRASYGSLGNGNINSYTFQEQFGISQSGRVLNGIKPQETSQPGVLPDGLTWETSTTRNLGLDLSMMKDQLSFTGDAYIRNTSDMFTVGMSLPAVFGTTVPKGNYADLRTMGWELSLAWKDHFSLASKPFNYRIGVSLSDYQSKITKYNNPDKKLSDYYAGEQVGEIWGYVTDGFFKSQDDIAKSAKQTLFSASSSGQWLPGDVKFKDLNRDGVIDYGDNTVAKPGDRKVIGNTTPRYSYGINLDMDWNSFFFSTFFQGVGKQNWWPGSEADYFWGQYNRPYNNIPVSQLGNIWSEDNPNAYFPRYRGYSALGGMRELGVAQTKYLQNIAYIRMKNIQIGYNLPSVMIHRLGMSNAKIYVSGENLWTWSPLYRISKNIDVENTGGSDRVLTDGNSGNGNNYPMLKSVTFGLSVVF